MKAQHVLICFAFVLILSACSPGTSQEDQGEVDADAVFTAAAETLSAQLAGTQTAQAAEASPTLSPVPATETPVPATATEALPTIEPDPELTVIEETVCRNGASTAIAIVATLEVGEILSVTGRSQDGKWWQVVKDGEECWVFWNEDAITLEGNVFSLAFVNAPTVPTKTAGPTPEPNFWLSFVNVNKCGNAVYAVFAVQNKGNETYESARVNIHDQTAGIDNLSSTDGNLMFLPSQGACPKGNESLGPLSTGYVYGKITGATSGNTLFATVRLCTENGLAGFCLKRNITFTAP
ncbi:MAG: hypothetical protein DWQ07_23435 [Chloroflexi bacterium]|nr:MAG: hypothetical protein DWQ07_23435 [Chloroflexota bacterium]MBL1194104.1 hypothetical protein [Chloroflexota bacterium]